MNFKDFFSKKRIFLTGHTGFKGSWLSLILKEMGAEVTGYSLALSTEPALYDILELSDCMESVLGDIREYDGLLTAMQRTEPEIVIHMAAQPIVRVGYREPRLTYETNVMGTVNLCEAIRHIDSVKSFLNVTTDKVYLNREWDRGYVEDDALDGYDPYSNSKSCSEIITHSYKDSFLSTKGIAVSTARAGNVIGGGDFSPDRIIPDCVKYTIESQPIIIRNPESTRPYQHVLDPLYAYLMIVKEQYEDIDKAGYYNIGPDDKDCVNTANIVDMFCECWGEGASWISKSDGGPHEARFLKLDSSKLKNTFGWNPKFNIRQAVEMSVEWYKAWKDQKGVSGLKKLMMKQVDALF